MSCCSPLGKVFSCECFCPCLCATVVWSHYDFITLLITIRIRMCRWPKDNCSLYWSPHPSSIYISFWWTRRLMTRLRRRWLFNLKIYLDPLLSSFFTMNWLLKPENQYLSKRELRLPMSKKSLIKYDRPLIIMNDIPPQLFEKHYDVIVLCTFSVYLLAADDD